MPETFTKWIAGLLMAGCLSVLAGGDLLFAADPVASPPTQQQLADWVAQLDHDDFFIRQKGTEELIKAGKPAVDALKPVLEGNSLEATTRAVHVLQELALSSDLETETAARTALEKTATTRTGAVARRASAALGTLNDLRQDRALTDLEKLGATLVRQPRSDGFMVVEATTGVIIGPTFTGTAEQLRLLTWIELPQFQVTFVGPEIKNEHLKHLAAMKTLSSVTIKRAAITDDGLGVLSEVGLLNDLAIMNTPITDKSFATLKACQGLTNVRLYGTKFSRETARQLQEALGVAKVDFRIGGFLGVGGQQTLQGCQVGIVQEGSAASKAGVLVGDIIVRVGDKKVADFESLTEIISQYAGGDTVELELLRGDEAVKKKITFGEWE